MRTAGASACSSPTATVRCRGSGTSTSGSGTVRFAYIHSTSEMRTTWLGPEVLCMYEMDSCD
jgi:hypothetical protein